MLVKFVIRLNEASFELMLTLHGQMTNLLARAYIHISSFATKQLLVGNPSLLLFSLFQLPLFEDNHGAICLAQHGHFKGRSKHLDLRWNFIKDCIDKWRSQASAYRFPKYDR